MIHGLHGNGAIINPFIWCAVGAVVGLLAGVLMGSSTKTVRIEEICVGIFGAFIGGEFVPSLLSETGTVDPGFSGTALMTGVAGAVVMLVLLKLMRRSVGPLRDGKSRMTKR